MPTSSLRRLGLLLLSALSTLAGLPAAAGEAASTAVPAATAPASDLLERIIALNRIQEPELDLAQLRQAFADLAQRAREAVAAAGADPRQRVAALNRTLLAEREVAYLSNLYWRDATLAASLLRRRGNCLSTSTLYCLVGERLGLPIRLVLVPHHAFVRWDDGRTRINIETTAQGRELGDERYFAMRAVTEEDRRALRYGASLDGEDLVAELTLVAAGHRREQGRIDEAIELLDQAMRGREARPDLRLQRIRMVADRDHDRAAARTAIAELIEEDLPPTVFTAAVQALADEVGAAGDRERERRMLLWAFPRAPKASEGWLLQQLAFCHRALKDYRGALRFMELAVALVPAQSPEMAGALYNLAICQKNDGRLDEALASIRRALGINPESWNLQVIEAGYLVLAGRREEGLARFAKVEPPRDDAEFFASMRAWFHAVAGDREAFFAHFRAALGEARSPHVLKWIQEDVDLDPYRDDPRFRELVERHRARLLGTAPGPTGAPSPAAVAP